MGRSIPLFTRAAVIACACAMLVICVSAVHAQTRPNDGYGLNPMPAPVMPVTQNPLGTPQSSYGPSYGPSYGQGTQPAYGQQSFAPAPAAPGYLSGYTPAPAGSVAPGAAAPYPPAQSAPPGYAQSYPPQNYAPAYPPAAPYPQAPMQAPMQAAANTQPYGYTALRPQPGQPQMNYQGQPGAYAQPAYAPAASRYGTQMTADPYAYTANSGIGANTNFNSAYVIGPGDKLRVSVFGEEDLTGEYVIDGSGVIRLPLIGTVKASGTTAPMLEQAIAGALAQGFLKSPRVNVEITAYRPFYIIGAVGRPGQYAYVDNMSVLNAVAFGGGFLDTARQSTVFIRHEGSPVEEEVPASQLTRVYPGDVVRVKTTLFWDAMSIFGPLTPAAIAASTIRF